MPFSSNIPQAPDLLNASQRDLLDNFRELETAIAVNHGTFGAADEGMHKWVTLPSGILPVNPIPGVNELVVKSIISRFTNRPELTFQPSGANFSYTMSGARQVISYSPGWAPVAPGLIMKWGTIESAGITIVGYLEGPDWPEFSAPPYHITLSPARSEFNFNVSVQLINIINEFSFSCICRQRTDQVDNDVIFSYLAIGPV